ncbi:hypothetical protein H5P27_02665 [Pelagicoccus albus]|uniref:Uncharacterized protein n=2 Tax=Pelagicoccus albus TaxID=415222 RepID=A0A7X1B3P1_9BACT|nr:hypothetical protein [Pelagicoccus albus]MBC2604937.1 hypothetical protein [Pelagicoccus albus]
MSIDELVAVNSLLIERETCLADLSHIETTISDILGQEYPFELPAATLPSTQKGKRVKAPKKKKAKAAPKIRRLKEPEIAYRVVLQENGENLTHDLLDFSPFLDLIATPLPNHRIQSVATLGPTFEVVESLFESE